MIRRMGMKGAFILKYNRWFERIGSIKTADERPGGERTTEIEV